MKEEIEEAQVTEETTTSLVLVTDFEKPTLPTLLKKDESIETIKAVRDKYSIIEIVDTKDKENYNKVAAGKKELRDSRLAYKSSVLENIIDPAKEWFNGLKADYTTILQEFADGEEELKAKLDVINDKRKAEKEEEDARKLKVYTERVLKLTELGGKPNEVNYVFDYDLTLYVKIATLKDLDEAKWQKQLDVIQLAYNTEQTRIENEKIASANLLAETNALAEQNKAKQRKLRLKELTMEGFVESLLGEGLYEHTSAYPGRTVSMKDIDVMTDDEWDAMIIDFSGYEPMALEETEEVAFADETPATPLTFTGGLNVDTEPESLPASAYTPASTMKPSTSFETSTEPEVAFSEEPAFIERTLVFANEKPFLDVSLTGALTQRLFPDEYRELALEGLVEGTYQEGQIDESLLFVVFKK